MFIKTLTSVRGIEGGGGVTLSAVLNNVLYNNRSLGS